MHDPHHDDGRILAFPGADAAPAGGHATPGEARYGPHHAAVQRYLDAVTLAGCRLAFRVMREELRLLDGLPAWLRPACRILAESAYQAARRAGDGDPCGHADAYDAAIQAALLDDDGCDGTHADYELDADEARTLGWTAEERDRVNRLMRDETALQGTIDLLYGTGLAMIFRHSLSDMFYGRLTASAFAVLPDAAWENCDGGTTPCQS